MCYNNSELVFRLHRNEFYGPLLQSAWNFLLKPLFRSHNPATIYIVVHGKVNREWAELEMGGVNALTVLLCNTGKILSVCMRADVYLWTVGDTNRSMGL